MTVVQINMRFPGFLKKALTLSYDDGVDTDIKMIEILNKYGIKGTFNLNSGLFSELPRSADNDHYFYHLTKKQALELYTVSGHEVAVHTRTHPFLEKLSPEEIAREIMEDRRALEEMFGVVVRGMAYPFGTYDDRVVNIAAACGIAYSRTVVSTGCFDIPTDWFHMNTTCHHNDSNLMKYATDFVDANIERPLLFYLWGHTYEFRSDNNWHVIEDFCHKVGNRSDVWYATNIEVYDYVEAFNSLSFSADYSLVYNPSVISVCFEKDGVEYCAAGGKTTKL